MTTSPETTATESTEEKREIPQAKRDELAKTPKALNDGSYPIENVGDLKNAISAYGRAPEEKREELRAHIVRNAKRLNATNMLPKNWSETPAKEKKEVDPFTAGVLLALAGFDADERLELKAGPPGATFPSPDPGATKLRKYWTKGPGAAKIRWGSDGDFDRCVTNLRKHVGERAKGLCNIYHRSAMGAPPGKGHKSAVDDVETKQLWVPDDDVPGGWRAHEPAWTPEVKEARVDNRTDDEVLADLDRYEAMTQSVEEAYEEAIAADIAWEMEPKGDLVDPDESAETAPALGNEGEPGPSLFGDVEDES